MSPVARLVLAGSALALLLILPACSDSGGYGNYGGGRPQRGGMGGGRMGGSMGGGPGGTPSNANCPAPTEAAVDHSMTRQQFIDDATKRAGETFDKLDADKDGLVTPEERRACMRRPS